MAKLSRNARLKARKKRTISQQGRLIREQQKSLYNTHLMLLAVLGQQGGEVTISVGTFQQTIQGMRTLNWSASPNPLVPGETIVRLIVAEGQTDEPTESLPAADGSDDQTIGQPGDTPASSDGPQAQPTAGGSGVASDIHPVSSEGAD